MYTFMTMCDHVNHAYRHDSKMMKRMFVESYLESHERK
jgi:hypothetical protein